MHLVRGIPQLHRDGEIDAGRTAAEAGNTHNQRPYPVTLDLK
jgi:hypothetical protein